MNTFYAYFSVTEITGFNVDAERLEELSEMVRLKNTRTEVIIEKIDMTSAASISQLSMFTIILLTYMYLLL